MLKSKEQVSNSKVSRMNYRRWTFEELQHQIREALSTNQGLKTLSDYRKWRQGLEELRSEYPSIDTIQRLKPNQYEQIEQLFSQGQVGRPMKWTEPRIWECLKEAYHQSCLDNQPFSPQYYRQWRDMQSEETPAYSTINEWVGSFKEIRAKLEVEDHRFEQNSNRPKQWTEEAVWKFLETAYRELEREELKLTQQTFTKWREMQLAENRKIPSLSTIKTVLGGGGFSLWSEKISSKRS